MRYVQTLSKQKSLKPRSRSNSGSSKSCPNVSEDQEKFSNIQHVLTNSLQRCSSRGQALRKEWRYLNDPILDFHEMLITFHSSSNSDAADMERMKGNYLACQTSNHPISQPSVPGSCSWAVQWHSQQASAGSFGWHQTKDHREEAPVGGRDTVTLAKPFHVSRESNGPSLWAVQMDLEWPRWSKDVFERNLTDTGRRLSGDFVTLVSRWGSHAVKESWG